jgi:hypothetical protein
MHHRDTHDNIDTFHDGEATMTRIRIVAAFCGFALLGLAPVSPRGLGPSPAFAGETCKYCITINLLIVGGKYCYEGSCGGAEAPAMPHWIP